MHTLTDLPREQNHIQLGQVVLLIRDPVEEFTSIHILHDQGEAVLALKSIIKLDQVYVAELVHDVDLILHILLVGPEGKWVSQENRSGKEAT